MLQSQSSVSFGYTLSVSGVGNGPRDYLQSRNGAGPRFVAGRPEFFREFPRVRPVNSDLPRGYVFQEILRGHARGSHGQFKKPSDGIWFAIVQQVFIIQTMVDQNGNAKKSAAALLRKEMAFVNSIHPDTIISEHSVNDLLFNDECIHRILFSIIGNDDVTRTEYFGIGNDSIEIYFNEIRNELLRLSRTGKCDRETLLEGEATLADLIRGIRKYEHEMKEWINPDKAEEMALFTRTLMRKPAAERATPNEIDEEQTTALSAYQWARRARLVLETIQATITQINHELEEGDKFPPARSR